MCLMYVTIIELPQQVSLDWFTGMGSLEWVIVGAVELSLGGT